MSRHIAGRDPGATSTHRARPLASVYPLSMSGTPTLSEVRAFRARHLEAHVGPRYNGWLHFATTSIGSLAAIAFAVSRVRSPSLVELASIPIFFLIANLGEYFG